MRAISVPIAANGLVLSTLAQAEEHTYDISTCFVGTVSMLTRSKELTVYPMESKGITRSNTDLGVSRAQLPGSAIH